ncbi:MAG: transglutaminase domain-containing protein [Anaerolineae bacterium]|nr:transglutaminase domain-containing protein [Anaerolineae bacterium]
MTTQAFYMSQSFITDPKEFSYLYQALPHDIPGLCHAVQGLVLHYVGERHLVGGTIPYARLCEIDTRYAPRILARLLEMDSRTLTEARTPANRFVGCCRDFSVLFCSMLRYLGVPARTRSGFADYFVKGYYIDHVVVEYWNGTSWQLVDSELPPDPNWGFDVTNVPRDRFVVGGMAWQMCRREKADPELFGLWPEVPVRGWGFIRGRLMHDLAALNKHEMLCWDQWNYADPDLALSSEDEALLDRVASATQGGNDAFDEVRALFADPRLAVPTPMKSWSPAQERLMDVTLAR